METVMETVLEEQKNAKIVNASKPKMEQEFALTSRLDVYAKIVSVYQMEMILFVFQMTSQVKVTTVKTAVAQLPVPLILHQLRETIVLVLVLSHLMMIRQIAQAMTGVILMMAVIVAVVAILAEILAAIVVAVETVAINLEACVLIFQVVVVSL